MICFRNYLQFSLSSPARAESLKKLLFAGEALIKGVVPLGHTNPFEGAKVQKKWTGRIFFLKCILFRIIFNRGVGVTAHGALDSPVGNGGGYRVASGGK